MDHVNTRKHNINVNETVAVPAWMVAAQAAGIQAVA